MTAAARPPDPALDGAIIARQMAPTDPVELVDGLAWALRRSMKARANDTLHLDSCRNARVNSTWWPCQEECVYAQILLVWAEAFAHLRRRPARRQQACLFDEVAG